MTIWKRLAGLLTYEPAVAAWAAAGGLAVLLGSVAHLSTVQEAAVTTIATALAALYTAVQTRPVAVSALVGALATGITAAAGFGLHVSPTWIGVGTAVLSAVLSVLLRPNITPAARLRRKPGPVAAAA